MATTGPTPFTDTEHGILREKDGELITNFTAQILKETRYTDGLNTKTKLTITGTHRGNKLPTITIDSDKFQSMSWVLSQWGTTTVIAPTQNAERDTRAAIQLNSEPEKETIYTHTGWTRSEKDDIYLTGGGALTKKRFNRDIRVELPPELSNYRIKPVSDPRAAIRASLTLTTIAPKPIAWTLVTATMRPPLERTDYALHISGRTGTFKSEITSLMQSHYGPEMDARNLPGSWSSTGNAIEAQAYRIKDGLYVLDDFVPFGTGYQVRQLQKTADSIMRGAGNQAGRARLRDTSDFQQTMYPRGLIMSSGEDIPVGQSIRARMMILDLTPGDINTKILTASQAKRTMYQHTTAAWIQYIARDKKNIITKHRKRAKELMIKHTGIGHARTPAMLGDLIATLEEFIEFCYDAKAINRETATRLISQGTDALINTAKDQERHLTETDPAELYATTLLIAMQTGYAHVRTVQGGIPENGSDLGWTSKAGVGELPTWTHHGQQIGWYCPERNELLVEQNIAFPIVTKTARGQLTISKNTMTKRLKDAGFLTRTDPSRDRNTVRVQCEGRVRNVIALDYARLTKTQETQE